jgi:hypothetical protein
MTPVLHSTWYVNMQHPPTLTLSSGCGLLWLIEWWNDSSGHCSLLCIRVPLLLPWEHDWARLLEDERNRTYRWSQAHPTCMSNKHAVICHLVCSALLCHVVVPEIADTPASSHGASPTLTLLHPHWFSFIPWTSQTLCVLIPLANMLLCLDLYPSCCFCTILYFSSLKSQLKRFLLRGKVLDSWVCIRISCILSIILSSFSSSYLYYNL